MGVGLSSAEEGIVEGGELGGGGFEEFEGFEALGIGGEFFELWEWVEGGGCEEDEGRGGEGEGEALFEEEEGADGWGADGTKEDASDIGDGGASVAEVEGGEGGGGGDGGVMVGDLEGKAGYFVVDKDVGDAAIFAEPVGVLFADDEEPVGVFDEARLEEVEGEFGGFVWGEGVGGKGGGEGVEVIGEAGAGDGGEEFIGGVGEVFEGAGGEEGCSDGEEGVVEGFEGGFEVCGAVEVEVGEGELGLSGGESAECGPLLSEAIDGSGPEGVRAEGGECIVKD